MKVRNIIIAIATIAIVLGLTYNYWSPYVSGSENQLRSTITAYYEDGTSETVRPTASLLPLSVEFSGGKISHITVALEAMLTWTEPTASSGYTSSVDVQLDSVSKRIETATGDSVGIAGVVFAPTSGQWVPLQSVSVTAAEIEDWDASTFTTHTIKFLCSASVTLRFPDGSVAVRDGTTSAAITVDVVSAAAGVSALDLTAESTPFSGGPGSGVG